MISYVLWYHMRYHTKRYDIRRRIWYHSFGMAQERLGLNIIYDVITCERYHIQYHIWYHIWHNCYDTIYDIGLHAIMYVPLTFEKEAWTMLSCTLSSHIWNIIVDIIYDIRHKNWYHVSYWVTSWWSLWYYIYIYIYT